MIGKCVKCKLVYDWETVGVNPRRLFDARCPKCHGKLVRTTYLSQLPRSEVPPIRAVVALNRYLSGALLGDD